MTVKYDREALLQSGKMTHEQPELLRIYDTAGREIDRQVRFAKESDRLEKAATYYLDKVEALGRWLYRLSGTRQILAWRARVEEARRTAQSDGMPVDVRSRVALRGGYYQ